MPEQCYFTLGHVSGRAWPLQASVLPSGHVLRVVILGLQYCSTVPTVQAIPMFHPYPSPGHHGLTVINAKRLSKFRHLPTLFILQIEI